MLSAATVTNKRICCVLLHLVCVSSPCFSGDNVQVKKSKKKKKKGKLPKNYEEGAEIDAERWLPMRERSYYRGKRKKNKKDVGKGPQGGYNEKHMQQL